MNNSFDDLLILRRLNVQGRVPKAPQIMTVNWYPPCYDGIKVDVGGATNGSLGPAGSGGIFKTYRGFCKGCFSIPIAFTYEAEFLTAINAILFASQYG